MRVVRSVRSGVRRAGLTLLEVLIAATLLAIVLIGIASMSGTTQTSITDLDLTEAANNSARSTLESYMATQFTGPPNPVGYSTMHQFYNAFRQADPAFVPKCSALFEVRAPGLPLNNTYGSVVVREPTAVEAPRYNNGNGPRYAYVNPANPYLGVSSSLAGLPNMTTTTEPKLYLVIVEVNIPPGPGHPAPVRVRLQSWRFWL